VSLPVMDCHSLIAEEHEVGPYDAVGTADF